MTSTTPVTSPVTTPVSTRPKLPYLEPTTILTYGITGSGKDYGIAQLAKDVFFASGGKVVDGQAVGGLKTRLYQFDSGDSNATVPLQKLGIIELIDCRNIPHAFIAAKSAAMGKVPKLKGTQNAKGWEQGTWVEDTRDDIGLFAFNGLTAISEADFSDLRDRDAAGENVGGNGSMSFVTGNAQDGWGTEKIGSSNIAHYNVWGTNMKDLTTMWGRLAVRRNALVLVTASEVSSKSGVRGPQSQGDKTIDRTPGLFNFTFHLTREYDKTAKVHKYKLWLDQHSDMSTGNMTALANPRWPEGFPLEKRISVIEPADLPKALRYVQDATRIAIENVAKGLA